MFYLKMMLVGAGFAALLCILGEYLMRITGA